MKKRLKEISDKNDSQKNESKFQTLFIHSLNVLFVMKL